MALGTSCFPESLSPASALPSALCAFGGFSVSVSALSVLAALSQAVHFSARECPLSLRCLGALPSTAATLRWTTSTHATRGERPVFLVSPCAKDEVGWPVFPMGASAGLASAAGRWTLFYASGVTGYTLQTDSYTLQTGYTSLES